MALITCLDTTLSSVGFFVSGEYVTNYGDPWHNDYYYYVYCRNWYYHYYVYIYIYMYIYIYIYMLSLSLSLSQHA